MLDLVSNSYLVLKVFRTASYVGLRTFYLERLTSCKSSGDGGEVTPVPIPNTEVKLSSADGSWGSSPARVGRCWAKSQEEIFLLGFF